MGTKLEADVARRIAFAAFLDRLAGDDRVDRGDWQKFAVAHYEDETLERVRRDCVRLSVQEQEGGWLEGQRAQFGAWARELRGTAD